MIIHSKSYPRAGLIGNPSDGYFGKTIAFIVRNFEAEVILYETPELKIQPAPRDESVFDSIDDLASNVRKFGYYGGIRLLKATVKRFYDYCQENRIHLDRRNFTLRYSSNIPPQVGMAGSSAIITACLRALMTFYNVTIPKPIRPSLVLSVENDELRIPAGLQDRVIQTYEGLVYMDFDKDHMERNGHGIYEEIDPRFLPPIYIAYTTKLSEGTEVFHNDIRGRFNRGDKEVIDAMEYWADLARQARDLLKEKKGDQIGPLLDANFDRRRALYELSPGNINMVETARAAGATAKFTGSGGAIVGTYPDESVFQKLVDTLTPLGMEVLKPIIHAT
ncbi:MAG: GHMP kinase [Verrucomicrobiota bacterium]